MFESRNCTYEFGDDALEGPQVVNIDQKNLVAFFDFPPHFLAPNFFGVILKVELLRLVLPPFLLRILMPFAFVGL